MLKKINKPQILFPLVLITPFIFIAHYGITVLEVIIIYTFFVSALPKIIDGSFRLPRFLLIFLMLYSFGWLGAVINGLIWNVPIGYWNLNFIYKAFLTIGAYYIGLKYYQDPELIVTGSFFYLVVLCVGMIAATYPFLTPEQRFSFFGIFYMPESGAERYFTSSRFPGLGINANIYSFFIYCYLLFSFHLWIKNKTSTVIPIILFGIILVLSSKLVIFLSTVSCAAILVHKSVRAKVIQFSSQHCYTRLWISKRRLCLIGLVAVFSVSSLLFVTQTAPGRLIAGRYATIERFKQFLEPHDQPYGLELRVSLWERGLERVQLAPFFGIPRNLFSKEEGHILSFYNPHNEFIKLWMLYGFMGLIAFVYLIIYLSVINLSKKSDISWKLIFPALGFFLFFDGGVEAPRVVCFLFMLIGSNIGRIRYGENI